MWARTPKKKAAEVTATWSYDRLLENFISRDISLYKFVYVAPRRVGLDDRRPVWDFTLRLEQRT